MTKTLVYYYAAIIGIVLVILAVSAVWIWPYAPGQTWGVATGHCYRVDQSFLYRGQVYTEIPCP